jgi:VWFA-related protein
VAHAPRPLRKASLASLLVLSFSTLPAQITSPSQEPAAHKPRAPLVNLSSAVPDGLFRIDAEVMDAAGNPVTDLGAGEFTLLDNGQPTRIHTLNNSTRTTSEPAPTLIFVLDAVNLSSKQLNQAESAIAHLLLQNNGRLDQPCFLYRLTRDGLYSSVKPTRDGNLLARELGQNKSPRIVWRADQRSDPNSLGSWDAGQSRNPRSVRTLGSIAIDQRDVAGRKVVVWIGPGWPVAQGGDNGFEEATGISTRMREARITLDEVTVWQNPDPKFFYLDYLEAPLSQKDMQPAKMALPVIATHTGGLVLESSGDLDRDIALCAADARSYYTLTFNPPRTDRTDEYHEIHVSVARPGVTARVPTGYYNEPVYFDNPRHGIEKVTVAKLEQLVHSEPDLAHRLANLELTQRLSTPRLDSLLAVVHGERERQALTAAADLSLALPPPEDELVNQQAPEVAEQRAIIQRTFDYLRNSIPKLPDFFALRNTVRYEEPPMRNDESWKVPHSDQSLRFGASEHATVLYRNGDEVTEKKQKIGKHRAASSRTHNFETWGTFGPILGSVLTAAAKGGGALTWSRWERGVDGNLAVFSFNIPATTNAQFEVTYCCLPKGNGSTLYHNTTGYSGEFAVNPDSGAVMRIVITADLDEDRDPTAPLIRSQVMVEYGPQELGGKIYICPRRSVSITRGRTVREMHEWAMAFQLYGYFETMINDMTFGGYHKFGSEARILTGFDEVQETGPASPTKTH